MNLEYRTCHLLHRELLAPSDLGKTTFHLELSWDPTCSYQPGDSLAIRPHNHPELVKQLIERVETQDRAGVTTQLTQSWSVTRCSAKLLRYLASRSKARANLEQLSACLEDRQQATHLLERHDLLELLEWFDATLDGEQLSEALMPLLPRFYSIASSPMADPSRVALTVAHVSYQQHRPRVGVCSDYLWRLAQQGDGVLEAALHPTRHFHLAPPSADLIMIGPGTGVAPFRAFMQQRLLQKASGRSWLFFGERYRQCLFYESLWQECQRQLPFTLTCAFSREQPHKIYVQHKIREHAAELAPWLDHAFLYLCGDAKEMARDVEHALIELLIEQRGLDESSARSWLRGLRESGRYLRDVY